MPTVYVVQAQHRFDRTSGSLVPKFDLSPAQRFGELRYLLSPTASPFSSAGVIREMSSALDGYNPSEDSLLLIGNPCLIGFAVALASERSETGRVRMLQWSGKEHAYVVVEAEIYPLAR